MAADLVDIGRLEKVIWVRGRDSNGGVAHAAGEARQTRLRAVEVAVVVGRKEVTVCRVADDPHYREIRSAITKKEEGTHCLPSIRCQCFG